MDYSSIDDIVDKFQKAYADAIAASGHNASGKLAGSVQHILSFDGRFFTVTLRLEDYWKNLEYGRRPGKFPPIANILEWIRVKPILPRADKNGKLPTEDQLAFLIGRKIARDGIPATHLLRNTLSSYNLVGKVYKAFAKEFSKRLSEQDNS